MTTMNKHRNFDRNAERQERSEQPRARHENRHQARENNRGFEERPSRVKPEQTPFNAAEYNEALQAGLKVFEADSFHDIFSAMQQLQQAFWLARRGGPQVVRDFAKSIQINRAPTVTLESPVKITGHVEVSDLKNSVDDEQFVPTGASDGRSSITEYVASATASLPQDKETNEFRHDLIAFDYFYEFSTSDAHKRQHQAIEESIFEAINTNGSAWLVAAKAVYDHVGRELNFE